VKKVIVLGLGMVLVIAGTASAQQRQFVVDSNGKEVGHVDTPKEGGRSFIYDSKGKEVGHIDPPTASGRQFIYNDKGQVGYVDTPSKPKSPPKPPTNVKEKK